MDVVEQAEHRSLVWPAMRLHVHEWGNAAAPTVVCVHGVSATRPALPATGRGTAGGSIPRRSRRIYAATAGRAGSRRGTSTRTSTTCSRPSATTGPSPWVGHSFGGRLVLELAARRPELVRCAVLLDPAIDILPHVGFDFAQDAATGPRLRVRGRGDRRAPDERLPDAALARSRRRRASTSCRLATGSLRWRYARAAVATMYSELCREPPPPTALAGIPTLLVHAEQFGLVREEQLEEYAAALGDGLELVGVPGRPRRLLGRLRRDRRRGREVPDSSQSRFTRVNRSSLG